MTIIILKLIKDGGAIFVYLSYNFFKIYLFIIFVFNKDNNMII